MPSRRPPRRRAGADGWTARAKARGYPARSVFKLEALDLRFGLLRPGQTVLDLGCHPGSWLRYAARRVGPDGWVLGIDLTPTEAPAGPARTLAADVFALDPRELDRDARGYDVVLSDMAPDTTGVPDTDRARSAALAGRALDFALALLRPGGALVVKVFGGPEADEIFSRASQGFARVRRARPEAVRKASTELYVVALGRQPS